MPPKSKTTPQPELPLLVCLSYCDEDSRQAERILDLIALYRNKVASGIILLVAAPDVHGENRSKIEIAARIGFADVDFLSVGWPANSQQFSKAQAVNNMFFKAAQAIGQWYRLPWLWLEPDSIPLKASWFSDLAAAYYAQPRRYLGPILADAEGKKKTLGRVAVYPSDAINELGRFSDAPVPFEQVAGELVVPGATKTRLIQALSYDQHTDASKVREDAVLLHHDKAGILLQSLWEKAGGKEVKQSPEEIFGGVEV